MTNILLEKKGLIATYEKSIQSAFKDVADALARRETLSEQLDAQRQYVAAEQTSLDIALKRYQTGVGDYLSVLTAQRTLWSAQATLISLQQTDYRIVSSHIEDKLHDAHCNFR